MRIHYMIGLSLLTLDSFSAGEQDAPKPLKSIQWHLSPFNYTTKINHLQISMAREPLLNSDPRWSFMN